MTKMSQTRQKEQLAQWKLRNRFLTVDQDDLMTAAYILDRFHNLSISWLQEDGWIFYTNLHGKIEHVSTYLLRNNHGRYHVIYHRLLAFHDWYHHGEHGLEEEQLITIKAILRANMIAYMKRTLEGPKVKTRQLYDLIILVYGQEETLSDKIVNIWCKKVLTKANFSSDKVRKTNLFIARMAKETEPKLDASLLRLLSISLKNAWHPSSEDHISSMMSSVAPYIRYHRVIFNQAMERILRAYLSSMGSFACDDSWYRGCQKFFTPLMARPEFRYDIILYRYCGDYLYTRTIHQYCISTAKLPRSREQMAIFERRWKEKQRIEKPVKQLLVILHNIPETQVTLSPYLIQQMVELRGYSLPMAQNITKVIFNFQ